MAAFPLRGNAVTIRRLDLSPSQPPRYKLSMAQVKKFGGPSDPGRRPTTADRVVAAIEEMFADPDVTAELVGLASGIGPRRVKALLANEETSLRAELLTRRMEKARKLLVETNFAIDNVAYLCGYKCASTFAKRFAEQHNGQSPRRYRVARGGTPRSGGVTGAFRRPAQRARAREQGNPPPSMSPFRALPGHWQVVLARHQNERRRAQLRGEEIPPRPVPPSAPAGQHDPPLDAYIDAYLGEVEDEFFGLLDP
jgi:AraC-like DNA-binding protein